MYKYKILKFNGRPWCSIIKILENLQWWIDSEWYWNDSVMWNTCLLSEEKNNKWLNNFKIIKVSQNLHEWRDSEWYWNEWRDSEWYWNGYKFNVSSGKYLSALRGTKYSFTALSELNAGKWMIVDPLHWPLLWCTCPRYIAYGEKYHEDMLHTCMMITMLMVGNENKPIR